MTPGFLAQTENVAVYCTRDGNAKYEQAAEDVGVLDPVIVVLHAVNSKRDNPDTDVGYRVDEEEA